VAAHRHSRRRAGEHGGQTRARATVSYGESICVPGGAEDQAEGAADGEAELGGSGERRVGMEAILAKGRPGLDGTRSEG
jgi:hypothetical protein